MSAPVIHCSAKTLEPGKTFSFTVMKCSNLPVDVEEALAKSEAYIKIRVQDEERKTPLMKDSPGLVFLKDNTFSLAGGPGTVVELFCMDWIHSLGAGGQEQEVKVTVSLTEEVLLGGEQKISVDLGVLERSDKLEMNDSNIGDNAVVTGKEKKKCAIM